MSFFNQPLDERELFHDDLAEAINGLGIAYPWDRGPYLQWLIEEINELAADVKARDEDEESRMWTLRV